jgi:hypothetical protein
MRLEISRPPLGHPGTEAGGLRLFTVMINVHFILASLDVGQLLPVALAPLTRYTFDSTSPGLTYLEIEK